MLSRHEPRTQPPCCEEAQAVTLVRTHWSVGPMIPLIAPAEHPADSKCMKTPLGAFSFPHLNQAQPFEAFHLRLDITKLSVFLIPEIMNIIKWLLFYTTEFVPQQEVAETASHSISSSRTETSFLLAFLFTGLWDHLFSVLLTKNLGLPWSRFTHVDPFISTCGCTGSLLLHGGFL